MAYAAKFSGINGTHDHSFVVDQNVRASISVLLRACSPSAVVRAVWPVVVDTVKGMQKSRSDTHVRKEIGKVIPAIADRDSSTSVPRIGSYPRIVATRAHIHPNAKFSADHPVRGLTVLRLGFDNRRKPKTPTTIFPAVSELLCSSLRFISTIASATPLHQSATIRGLFNNRQSTEACTRKINEFSHAYIIHASHSFGVQ